MKSPLRAEAQELLREARSADGELFVLDTQHTGKWVRVGQCNYAEGAEMRHRYLDALQDLIGAGLVEAAGGVRYELTTPGWEAAKEL